MSALSILEVPKLKETAEKYGYTVHLHDACGGQSFTLEVIDSSHSDGVYDAITHFFSQRNMTVNFYDAAKLNFTVK